MDLADLYTMEPLRLTLSRVPAPVARSLIAFGFLLAFFAAAAVIHPGSSTARPSEITPAPSDTGTRQHDQQQPRAILGTLEGRQFRVEILAATPEPRFNVYDALGNPIALDIDEDALYRIDPLLDLSSMLGGGEAPALMLLEHDLDF